MIGWRKAQIYKRYSYFWANILWVKEKKICRFFLGSGAKIKIPLLTLTFCLPCSLISKKVWHNSPAPKHWEEIDMVGRSLFGDWAWPEGLRDPNHLPKNYLQKDPENLTIIQRWGQKIFHIVAVTDRQTDRRTDGRTERQTDRETDRQTERQTDRLKFFFLNYFIAWGDRKLWTWKISTISLRKVCFAHFTRVG